MSTAKVESEKMREPSLNLDKILVEEIGQFGKFQMRIICQCILAAVFIAGNTSEFVFTAGRIETRCVIPECEDPAQTVFAPGWIANAVPSSGGSVDNCQRFGNSSVAAFANDSCSADLFDTSVLLTCDRYLYENTKTIVYDFDLACEEWKRAMVGSVRVLGMMFALALTGAVSDGWGRRCALALNTCSAPVFGLARYWAPSYIGYVGILFLESVTAGATYSCAYVMTVELLGPSYRVRGGAIISTSFAVGQMLLGVIAWASADWRSLILALYVPQFICIIFFWTLGDSVRWLLNKGKFKEAEELLTKAARVNGRQLTQKTLDDLRANTAKKPEPKATNQPSLALLVLRNRKILVRCLVSCVWWVATTFVYYGLSFNAVNLIGNQYANYVMVAAVEIPACWTLVLILDKVGRKPTLICFFWLCTACQVAFLFIPEEFGVLSVVTYMVGKWCIAVVITLINVYTLELFPTECRHRMYSFASMVGRVGTFVAPLTPALGVTILPELPFLLFGGAALVAGVLTLFVPETRGARLPDTMQEALSLDTPDEKDTAPAETKPGDV